MKHSKFISFLLAALMLFSLCACGNDNTSASVHPSIAPPGADAHADLSLPAKIRVEDAGETASLYELTIDDEAAVKQIEGCFGIELSKASRSNDELGVTYTTDDYIVDIESDNGYWSVISRSSPSAKSGASMSDAEALKIAKAFVEENSLWPEEIENVKVVDQYGTNEDNVYGVDMKSVFFYPQVDGKIVLGRYRINININLDGSIQSVHCLVSRTGSSTTAKLKSSADISADLQAENYSASFTSDLTSAKITDCTLCYYADSVKHDGKTYLFPVYVMNGEGTNAGGEKETFEIIIDALK